VPVKWKRIFKAELNPWVNFDVGRLIPAYSPFAGCGCKGIYPTVLSGTVCGAQPVHERIKTKRFNDGRDDWRKVGTLRDRFDKWSNYCGCSHRICDSHAFEF